MIRRAFLATIAVFATASSLAAQTPSAGSPPSTGSPPPGTSAPANETSEEAMEEPKTGDHWTYEVRDEITGDIKSTLTQTITDVSDSEIGVRVAALGKPNAGYLTFDHSWNLKSNGAWHYSPNDGTGIRLPLAVGKSWTVKSTDINSTAGVSAKRSGKAKVTGQESVTTSAGTFDTFKVETSYQSQNSNDPTKKFQIVYETWYAPMVDHWVKRTFVSKSDGRVREKSSAELVEYGRR